MKVKEIDFVFPVYIYKNVVDSIVEICKKNKNEVFGYLVGTLYSWKGQKYILITHNLYMDGSVLGSEFMVEEKGGKDIAFDDRNPYDQVEYNYMEYSSELESLKQKEENIDLLRLGWWHSHPNFGCFLSTTDIATQETLQVESYNVALVVDPIRDEMEFFTLDKTEPNGYKALNFAIISSN